MNEEEKKLLELAVGDTRAVRIGESVLYPPVMVGGKAFQFDAWQNGFLYALTKFEGDMNKACAFIGKPVDWAQKFMSTRKFREFRNAKLQTLARRSGDWVDWWWEMGFSGAKGQLEWYQGTCALCHEENHFSSMETEQYRQDDMSLKALCKVCFQPITLEFKSEAFKPSREQVQFWAEIGQRLVPKIERVQHEFSTETFSFQTEEA